MRLQGKRILLGVTGSIAAYKAALLTRLLIKEGAEVQIIMSTSALAFITPLTLSTLSRNPVLHEFYHPKTGEWTNHVELGMWGDIYIIAPLSAHTLSKLANGSCDNLLTASYMSARCPVMVAPAMDLDMYQHPSLKANLAKIKQYGNMVLEAEDGELASGLVGQGRMMEPEHIMENVFRYFEGQDSLSGREFMITAGPTYEAIDPVRFIGNHSSGKMGVSIAEEVARQGGKVKLILGPGSLQASHPNIKTVNVSSAREMYEKAALYHQSVHCSVFAAAVADYTPSHPSPEKTKKNEEDIMIPLKRNIDIAYSLGIQKRAGQIHIGFALETSEEEKNAKAKLQHKNFDMVVLNSLKDQGAGFQHSTNKVTLFFKNGKKIESSLLPKTVIAALIVENIKKLFSQ